MAREPEQIRALIAAIEASPGQRLASRLKSLRVAGRVLSMNAQELLEDLEQLNQHVFAIHLFSVANRDLFEEYFQEIARHLHNWLASTKTLVDHARRYATSAAAGTFARRYNAKVTEVFSASAQVAFVHDMRNLVLHRNIPFVDGQLETRAGDPEIYCQAHLNVE